MERAVEWLLGSDEPGVRFQAERDLLDADGRATRKRCSTARSSGRCSPASRRTAASAAIRTRSGAVRTGGSSRSSSSASLQASRAASQPPRPVLDWLTGPGIAAPIKVIDGLTRRCGSQEGNALAVCCRLGLARRSARQTPRRIAGRVAVAGRRLELRQEGDGAALLVQRVAAADVGAPRVRGRERRRGCTPCCRPDRRALPRAPSLPPARGRRAHPAESFAALHYPPYWHYDFLQALVVLARMGLRRRSARSRRARPRSSGAGCPTAAGAPADAGGSRPAPGQQRRGRRLGRAGRARC